MTYRHHDTLLREEDYASYCEYLFSQQYPEAYLFMLWRNIHGENYES